MNAHNPTQPRTLFQKLCSPLLACLQLWGVHSLMKNPFLSQITSVHKSALVARWRPSLRSCPPRASLPHEPHGTNLFSSPRHPLAETPTAPRPGLRMEIWLLPLGLLSCFACITRDSQLCTFAWPVLHAPGPCCCFRDEANMNLCLSGAPVLFPGTLVTPHPCGPRAEGQVFPGNPLMGWGGVEGRSPSLSPAQSITPSGCPWPESLRQASVPGPPPASVSQS